jgi:predicted RND superfamily exporter protein
MLKPVMYILLIIIILIACIIVFFYKLYKSYSEEKAIIESFIQKYVSCIRRFTTIYEKILQGENNQAEQNLLIKTQDVNDALVLDEKKALVRVIRDKSIYGRIIKLNGYFARINDWEKIISAPDFQSSKSIMDSSSTSMMLQAFLGDVRQEDGSFYRYDFKEHIEDIVVILDYLNRINTHFLFRFLALLSSRSKEEIAVVGSFIAAREAELDSLRWRLEKLRLLEEKYLLEQK